MVWLTAWWCTRERHRWTLLVLTAVMVAFAVALPDSAEASSVGLASVHLSSTAAGATRVHYTVGFRTSGSGALTANTSTIDLQAPAGTAFPSGATDYTIIDLTTGERAFAAQVVVIGPGSTAVTLKTAINIGARDAVQIEIAGVTNTSATGAQQLMISTSADATSVAASYTLAAATSVGAPKVQLSARAGGATHVRYAVQFTTSKSGGLASGGPDTAGTITLAAPAGTVFPSSGGDYSLTNLTRNRAQNFNQCCGASVTLSNGGATVTVTVGDVDITSGDRVQLVVFGVTNASAGVRQLGISTSSDTVATNAGYTLLAPRALAQLSARRSSAAPNATGVTYRVQFVTSSGGGLASAPDASTITIQAPAGTALPSSTSDYAIRDMTTFACCGVGGVTLSNAGATATITLGEFGAAAGDAVELVISNVTNAASGSSLTAFTSSDPTPLAKTLGLLPGASIGPTRVDLVSRAAGATHTRYVLNFVGTNQLVSGTSQITITGPAGTSFPTTGGDYQIRDTTTGATQGPFAPSVSGGGSSVTLTVQGFSADAGDAIQIIIDDVTNTSATGAQQLTISDAAGAAPFSLVGAQAVANRSLLLSSTAAGVAHVEYRVHFTTSSAGGLAGGASSAAVTLTAPAGTVFPVSAASYHVVDTTTGAAQGPNAPTVTLSNGGATVTLRLPVPDIRSGDDALLTIDNVTNGPAGGHLLGIATSSDTVPSNVGYTLAAAHAGSQVKVTPSSTTHGATGVTYKVHFATSSTGGLSGPSGSTITLAGPAGTVFPTSGARYTILDTNTGATNGVTPPTVGSSNGGATARLTLTGAPDIASGDHILITITNVKNAPAAGSQTLAVTTSSDTLAATGTFTLS